MPMSTSPRDDPEFNNPRPKPVARRWGSRFTDVLLMLVGLLLVVALLLPALRIGGGRSLARQAACMNNLRQITIALNAYASEHHALPPAYTVDANGRPLHSWRTLILPYLQQDALYRTIDLSKPWNDPVNAKAFNTALQVYHCPDLDAWPSNKTAYRASVGPHAFLHPTEPRPRASMSQDKASAIAVIEVARQDAIPWMAPEDADEAMILSIGPNSQLVHPAGLHIATANLHATFAPTEASPEARRHMISVDGEQGETIPTNPFVP